MLVSNAPHGTVGKFKKAKPRYDLSVETARAGVRMGGKGLCLDLCHYCSALLPQSSKVPHRASLVAQWLSALPASAGDTGSSPGLGGSHMPRSN